MGKISYRWKEVESIRLEWMIAAALEMKEKIIRLETADPDFMPPKHIREAAKKALDEDYHHRYPNPSRGLLELREAIAEKYRRESEVDYDSDSEILVTIGACEANFDVVHAVVDPGDEVLLTDPTYLDFQTNTYLAGGTPVGVPLDEEKGWRFDPEELERKVTRKTKLIIVNSPLNPTGTVLTKEEVSAIVEVAKKHDLWVLNDLVFDKILYDGAVNHTRKIAAFPGMKERTFTVSGLAKEYSMPGYRVGWVCGPADVLKLIIDVIHVVNTGGVSPIAQAAAIAALKGPQDFLKEWYESYKRRRDILLDAFDEIEGILCVKPQGGFMCFPNVSEVEKSSYKFAEYLLKEAKVCTSPGLEWGIGGRVGKYPTAGEGHLRIVYGGAPEEEIKEAAERIKKAVKKYKG